MGLKSEMYKLLADRDPGVKLRYEKYVTCHPEEHAKHRIRSWLYLILLNIRSLSGNITDREKKTACFCESPSGYEYSPEETAALLCRSEAVSFDVFDTLILRPFSSPADLFYIVGETLSVPDYKRLRIMAESTARKRKQDSGEVTLGEIAECLSEQVLIPAENLIEAELKAELSLCYANPFMKKVWDKVKKEGKRIVITTDMYLPVDFIQKLLEKNGFSGAEKIFVSCEYGCGKYNGGLFEEVKKYLGVSVSHIGDNYVSDHLMAKKQGFESVRYINVNSAGEKYRCTDMSSLAGSAYAGITNARLYCGLERYSPAYEYGYKAGGIAVLGYCSFIKKTADEKKADKVLFFSRDGYILKEVYSRLYPEDKTEYVYWSRAAAAKLSAYKYRFDFFRRFIFQKATGKYTAGELIEGMGISGIELDFPLSEKITPQNYMQLEKAVTAQYDKVLSSFEGMDRGARKCFLNILSGCKNAVAADCGWAGSGALLLDDIVNSKWGLDCRIWGVLAGTNTAYQSDSDFSDSFLQSGKISAYCFSPLLNREIYRGHNPAADHNVYFELLFGAPHPTFLGYEEEGDGYRLIFDEETENLGQIKDIHRGELDFAEDYAARFKDYPYMLDISGADAYAPFMHLIWGREKKFAKEFSGYFDKTVSGKKEKLH